MAAEVYTVNINTQPAVKSIASLEKELAEATEQLTKVEVGSAAFNELQKKAAKAKGEIDQFNKTTDMMSKGFQGWGENVAKVTSGLTGGITAATAAMQLMGNENEDVLNGIAKLQQLMAFTQGISAFKDLAEGAKTLKLALGALVGAASPFGAIAAALGAIALAWVAIKNKQEEARKGVEEYQATLDDLRKEAERINEDDMFTRMPAEVANKFKQATARMQEVVKLIDDIDAKVAEYDKGESELTRDEIWNLLDYKDKLKEEWEDLNDYQRKVVQALPSQVESAADAAERKLQDLAEANKFLNPFAEATTAKSGVVGKPKLPESEGEDLSSEEKRIEKLQELFDQYKQLLTEINPLNELQTIAQEEMNSMDLLADMRANDLLSVEDYERRKLEVQQHFQELRDDLAQAEVQAKLDASTQLMSGYASIFSSIASAMDESDEKQRKAMIAFQAASIVTSTIAGAIQAYTGAAGNTGLNAIPIVGPAIAQATGITNMVAVIASGAAQLANLRSKGESDSASLSGVGLSSSAASSTLVAPQQYSTAVEGANIESAVADSRVYVVESDIQKTGKRVLVQENENRY